MMVLNKYKNEYRITLPKQLNENIYGSVIETDDDTLI